MGASERAAIFNLSPLLKFTLSNCQSLMFAEGLRRRALYRNVSKSGCNGVNELPNHPGNKCWPGTHFLRGKTNKRVQFSLSRLFHGKWALLTLLDRALDQVWNSRRLGDFGISIDALTRWMMLRDRERFFKRVFFSPIVTRFHGGVSVLTGEEIEPQIIHELNYSY